MERTRTLRAAEDDPRELMLAAGHYLNIAFDCARPLAPPARLLLDTNEVSVGRGARRAWNRRDGVLRVTIPDVWMSTIHLRLSWGGGRWTLTDEKSKNGTYLRGARVEQVVLNDGDVVEVGNTLLVYRALEHLGAACDHEADPELPAGVDTLHPPWAAAVSVLMRVARSISPVLLVGDTGTGKELLAREIHAASGRRGAFTPVNCGAIARTLVEAEIFGARRGAFTGADEDRPGLARAADGGTLFLDEIAELPEAAQVALLRVLQEREVLPVGATRTTPVDLRVVAATHEDLAARVADGRFRADLYSRLCGFVTRVPRLGARLEDLGLLVGRLLPRLAGDRAERVTFARAAGRALLGHSWPFNVRELEHALRTALAVADGDDIALAHLPEALRGGVVAPTAPSPPGPNASDERQRILDALEACAGNQTRAARLLGVSRATLVNKLALHDLPRPRKK